MTETDYIRTTNLAKLRIVNTIMRDVMSGETYGISEDEWRKALIIVDEAIDELEENPVCLEDEEEAPS